jgi:outer membrane protein assembly factor BamB
MAHRHWRAVRRLATTTVIGAFAVAAVASPAEAGTRPALAPGWPQLQGNAAHTGFEPGETSVTSANVSQLAQAWTAAMPGAANFSDITVTNGTLYIAQGNSVVALSAATGAQLWQASFPGTVETTPAVQGGRVLVQWDRTVGGKSRGTVVALTAATGATLWSRRLAVIPGHAQPLSVPLTTTASRVYVSLFHQVLALGIAHGALIWTSPVLPGCSSSAPSAAGGLVVVGGGGEYVSALHASDGTLAWQQDFGGGCGSSSDNWVPAVSGGRVYAGLLNGVAKLNLDSGHVAWHNTAVGMVFAPLSVTASTVIAGAQDDTVLVGLDNSSGSVRWQSSAPPVIFVGGLATFGGLTWGLTQPGNNQAQAIAIDPATGNEVYSSPVYTDFAVSFPPPVISAGRVYINLVSEVISLALPSAAG